VRLTATTLNFGEVVRLLAGAPDGAVLGWDAAGVIVQAAADGTGPPAGTEVVTTHDATDHPARPVLRRPSRRGS
jgi:NADPH:quinone reductase